MQTVTDISNSLVIQSSMTPAGLCRSTVTNLLLHAYSLVGYSRVETMMGHNNVRNGRLISMFSSVETGSQ